MNKFDTTISLIKESSSDGLQETTLVIHGDIPRDAITLAE